METPLTTEQAERAAEYVGFAINLARLWQARRPDLGDDIESAAYQGLIEGVVAYDPAGNSSLATVIAFRVQYAIIDAIRTDGKRIDVEPLPYDLAHVPAPCRDDARFDRLIGLLPAPWVALMRLLYRDGMSHGQAAEVLGCNPQRVTRIHGLARDLLRKRLGASCETTTRREVVNLC